jgi:hypothetical protein
LRRGSIVRKTPINESVYEEGQRGNAESIQFRELWNLGAAACKYST